LIYNINMKDKKQDIDNSDIIFIKSQLKLGIDLNKASESSTHSLETLGFFKKLARDIFKASRISDYTSSPDFVSFSVKNVFFKFNLNRNDFKKAYFDRISISPNSSKGNPEFNSILHLSNNKLIEESLLIEYEKVKKIEALFLAEKTKVKKIAKLAKEQWDKNQPVRGLKTRISPIENFDYKNPKFKLKFSDFKTLNPDQISKLLNLIASFE
jgi:hypothetical protein